MATEAGTTRDTYQRLQAALAGRYTLTRELGHGGMSTVFEAKDTRLDRTVAVKLLDRAVTGTIGVERFVREIAITARLQHPAHSHADRIGQGRRAGLLRHAVRRRRVAARAAHAGAPLSGGRGGRDRARGGRRARLCACAGRGPPRHQAREHPDLRRPRPRRRFRHRARHRELQRLRTVGGDHRRRPADRHAGVHEPGAGGGPARRGRPERRLLARLRALRDAGGAPAVHGAKRAHRDDAARHHAAARAARAPARALARGGGGGRARHRQGSGRAIPDGQGVLRGAPAPRRERSGGAGHAARGADQRLPAPCDADSRCAVAAPAEPEPPAAAAPVSGCCSAPRSPRWRSASRCSPATRHRPSAAAAPAAPRADVHRRHAAGQLRQRLRLRVPERGAHRGADRAARRRARAQGDLAHLGHGARGEGAHYPADRRHPRTWITCWRARCSARASASG